MIVIYMPNGDQRLLRRTLLSLKLYLRGWTGRRARGGDGVGCGAPRRKEHVSQVMGWVLAHG